MASLRKRSDSKVWQCQFYVTDAATGGLRQVRQSTGHTNRKKAMIAAVELERAATGAIPADSDAARQAKAVFAEVVAEIERETFTALAARKYLTRLLAIATGESEIPGFTVRSWSEEWLRRKRRDSSKATMARYDGHLDAFLLFLGPRADKPLDSITPQDARKWRDSLQDAGRAGKTVLSYTKDVGAAYRAAIREGLAATNPFGALDALDTSDSQERKPFTGDEVGRLMAAAPSEEWRGLILVAAFTGLRLGDAAKLGWDAVDLDARRITLTPSKTRKKKREVRIPIQADLRAYFLAAPVAEDSPAAKIFPKLATTPTQSRDGLSAQFVRVMAKAGVSRGSPSRVLAEDEVKGAGRITWERGFHSLRHTFTTWLRTAGVSEEDRMALTGHTTRDSHQIYSHTDEEALRDAIDKLPSLKGGDK